MPSIETAADAVKASVAIVASVAGGDLTPSEAADVAKVIDTHVKTLEAAEFEARLTKLEEAHASK
jgi:hypothetical protein